MRPGAGQDPHLGACLPAVTGGFMPGEMALHGPLAPGQGLPEATGGDARCLGPRPECCLQGPSHQEEQAPAPLSFASPVPAASASPSLCWGPIGPQPPTSPTRHLHLKAPATPPATLHHTPAPQHRPRQMDGGQTTLLTGRPTPARGMPSSSPNQLAPEATLNPLPSKRLLLLHPAGPAAASVLRHL